MLDSPESESSGGPIPVITEGTRDKIFGELGLDRDFDKFMQSTGMSRGEARRSMAQSVFDGVLTFNPGFVRTILQTLTEIYRYRTGEINRYHVNYATIGMAVVLRAYQIESKESLTPGFERLEDGDLDRVKQIIRESIKFEQGRDTLLLEELLTAPRIPEHNINLNVIADKAGRGIDPIGSKEFGQGAVVMYRILSNFWGKVNPEPAPQ